MLRPAVIDNGAFMKAGVAAERTAGNLTLNSTAWADVDNNLDLVLPAAAGDIVICGLSGLSLSEAVDVYLTFETVAGGNRMGGGDSTNGQGVQAWRGHTSVLVALGGTAPLTLVAADISGGNVTMRLRYRTNTADNKTLRANASNPLQVWATIWTP